MINLTEMVSGKPTVSKDVLREVERKAHYWPRAPTIAVWNVTNACNLQCRHCYASAGVREEGELTTEESILLIDEIKKLGVRIPILSGGEPLIREDIYEICSQASSAGLMVLLSSNGTMISEQAISEIKRSGVKYVGVSLDGLREKHDGFRGVEGSFDMALDGLKALVEHGVRTGVRFTVVKYNFSDLPALIEFLEDLGIPRICVYHLVYAGRGITLGHEDLTPAQKREMLDFLLAKALEWKGLDAEIETVASPADGVYAYLYLKEKYPGLASVAWRYLEMRGGDPSAQRLINIDHLGNVHPDQFWWDYTFGNVKEMNLINIWYNEDPFIKKLREKQKYVKGKCGRCAFKVVCGGLRVRALRVYGDAWGEDPACFLSEEEVVAQ